MTKRTEFILEGEDFKKLTAAKVMEINVKSVGPETSCLEIAKTLIKGNFGSVPVIDKANRLLGVVSEQDLLKAIMEGKDMKGTTADEIMTESPVSASWDTKVEGLARLMLKKNFIRVPIVVPGERGENLVGIVARRDLIFSYLKALGYESF